MKTPTLYLAGGLFNVAERRRNLYIERHLKSLGHDVIVPQREALKQFNDGVLDLEAVANNCMLAAMNRDNLFVGCIDGPDADSGTSVEFGMAIAATGKAVVYRTDFRTAPEREVGVNAMFKCRGAIYIYSPCYITELTQVSDFYCGLAFKIHEVVTKSLM